MHHGGSVTAVAKLSSVNSGFVKAIYINAEVNISSRDTQGLPNEAVVSSENKNYIFEDPGKSNYKMIPVVTGISDDQFTEIIKADF